MAKISKKAAKEIATLYNSIHVAYSYMRESLENHDHRTYDLWRDHLVEAVKGLGEIGIEPIGFTNYLEY